MDLRKILERKQSSLIFLMQTHLTKSIFFAKYLLTTQKGSRSNVNRNGSSETTSLTIKNKQEGLSLQTHYSTDSSIINGLFLKLEFRWPQFHFKPHLVKNMGRLGEGRIPRHLSSMESENRANRRQNKKKGANIVQGALRHSIK